MSRELKDVFDRIRTFREETESDRKRYHKFKRWYRNDYSDIEMSMPDEDSLYRVNMVSLVARSSLANLFFQRPEVMVEPMETRTTQQAKLETSTLNDILKESDYRRVGRSLILDTILSGFYCQKIGYSADIVLDVEATLRERTHAEEENRGFVRDRIPKVRKTDFHNEHIPLHTALYEQHIRGELTLTDKALTELRQHIQDHYDAQHETGQRFLETVRGDRAYVDRVKPDHVQYDLWAKTWSRVSWFSEMMLVHVDDIKNNPFFDETARKSVTAISPQQYQEYTGIVFQKPNWDLNHALVFDYVDLREGTIRTLALGMEDRPLREAEYELGKILPSGHLQFGSFQEDPDHLAGIPEPANWEDQQKMVNVLSTVIVAVAKRNIPMIGVDSQHVEPEAIQAYREGKIQQVLEFANLDDKKISDVLMSLPQAEVSNVVVGVFDTAMRLISRLSGKGEVKLGGGDLSRTATASSLINQASGSMDEDNAGEVSSMVINAATGLLRVVRYLYSPTSVARSAGPDALEDWKTDWSIMEILDDRGVKIVPGSLRREITDTRLRQYIQLYGAVVQDPTVPPEKKLRILDLILKLGDSAVDLTDAIEAAPATGPSPVGQAGAQQGEGAGAPNQADLAQAGVANTGGGNNG